MSATQDLAANKALALQYFETVNSEGLIKAYENLIDDCVWWTALSPMTKWDMIDACKNISPPFAEPFKFKVETVTAEDNRVAVEASCNVKLENGAVYANNYHFLFILGDGVVKEVHEHNNTFHVVQTFSGE